MQAIITGIFPLTEKMNEKIVKKFNEKNCSIYFIHQQTGISYTTLSEIFNAKININKCAAETVFKLSLYFDCPIEDILNPISLIANASGKYRGIRYKWLPGENNTVDLQVNDSGKDKIIDQGRKYIHPSFYHAYCNAAEPMIDIYLKNKKVEGMLNGTIHSHA